MKRINRILKRQEFVEIIKGTPVIKTKHYVIHFRENSYNYSRIGISVSRKNGHAVVRNKIRRQIRSMITKNYDLTKPLDLVIIVRMNYSIEEFSLEESELIAGLKKIGEQP